MGPRVATEAQIRTGSDVLALSDLEPVVGPTLLGAAPNPMRARTEIAFTLEERGRARLMVFDVGGRRIRTLMDDRADAGRHTALWNRDSDTGVGVAPGVYFLRLEASGKRRIGKVVVAQ